MFPNLKAEMARMNINNKNLAAVLEITPDSIGNKMNSRTEFTRMEMFEIKRSFFPDLSIDYLFEKQENEILCTQQ